MHKLLGILLAGSLVVAACGGDDDDTTAEPSADTAATAGSDDTTAAEEDCATIAEAAAPEQALDGFPDNPDVTWTVEGSRTDEEGRAVVEVVPTPDEVGYPAFLLLSQCTGGEAVKLATYAFEDDEWVILSTTEDLGPIELEPTIEP